MPFGHTIKVKAPATVGPFPTCNGQTAEAALYNDAEGPTSGTETWQLGEATVQSINLYFVNLEKQVGLCNVVKTAVDMGMTRADGTSLMKPDVKNLGRNNGAPAYDYSSFTLGSVGVSPMSMAAAYASVAARGIYCSSGGHHEDRRDGHRPGAAGPRLAVPPGHGAGRRRRGELHPAARPVLAGHRGGPCYPGHTAAAKTGTANGGYFAAFAGYTPALAALRVGVQPGQPDQVPDALPERVLPETFTAGPVLPGRRCSVTTLRARPGSTPSCGRSSAGTFSSSTRPGPSSRRATDSPRPPSPPKPKKHGKGGGGGNGGGPNPGPTHSPGRP